MTNELNHTESALLLNLAAGDAAAYSVVYKQFYFRVYQYALRMLLDQEDAKDITADTFVKLWNRKEQFNSLDNISAFLFVTVKHGCLDFLKHLQVKNSKQAEIERALEAQDDLAFQRLEIKEAFMNLVYGELDKMPPKMREIFLLSFRDGLKPAEIASRLNLSVNTVSNQKSNAVNLLRKAMADKPLLLALLVFLESENRWMA